MNQAIADAYRPIRAALRRIEDEAIEARKERLLRKQWEQEQREEELADAIREKTRSESDLIKAQAVALQRPATPLQFVPVAVPKAEDSDPAIPKALRGTRYKKAAIVISFIAVMTPIILAAMAYWSQRSSPHGEPASPAHEAP